MTIKTLNTKTTKSAIARLLDVTEGAVRYHVRRMAADAVDGRTKQTFKAEAFAEAIEFWRSQHTGPLNLGVLHEWLRAERRPSGRDGVWRHLPVPRLRSIGRHSPASSSTVRPSTSWPW